MRAIALCALIACASSHPKLVLGEQPPPGCVPPRGQLCVDWYVEKLVVEVSHTEVVDPALARYVSGVADRLARAGGISMSHVRVRVIDDLDPQAEAWASGTIYVYRGALVRLRSEAELAGVLGHELGHLDAHHNDQPPADQRGHLDDEIEADATAVRLVAAAGYEPRAVETMLRAISAEQSVPCVVDDDDEHPCAAERIARIHALAHDLPAGELGVERFRAATAGVAIGDDPRRVAVVHGALVFANAGLALAPKASTVDIAERRGVVVQGATTAAVMTVSRAFGELLRDHPPDGQAFVVGDHGALWIMVIAGDARATYAAALASQVRPVTAAELAAIRPHLFDPAAPRVLWPAP